MNPGDPALWSSLVTLTMLEIVLGIDNVIFLAVVSERLPAARRPLARRIGLIGALAMRIVLLLWLASLLRLTAPLFALAEHTVTWRDIILGGGGLFLLYKGTAEIHHMTEGADEGRYSAGATFARVIVQIMVLDLVFSLDSVITAIGMAVHVEIMIAAIVISIAIMLWAAEPVAAFVNRHPTIKLLALSFLLLVGVALVADGLHFHIPRGYLYFAIAFSTCVEILNQVAARAAQRRREAAADEGLR